jgi:hypothetical protein
MNRIAKVLSSVLAAGLMLVSLQTWAATAMGGRDFNHMTTGFPLSGGHAVAACETCHAGGIFKGTPKNCDGCHAVGKRVVATPKTNSHIVTDAPCESCHFNTSTWLGARYNHGTAQPGGCLTCHNGRLSFAKPASHSTNINKATKSCDSCHRSSSWLPASWNHIGVTPGTCKTCHVAGGQAIGKPASHSTGIKGANQCDDCHSFVGWTPARYKHINPAACSTCHNGTIAVGKSAGHVATTDECSQCHFSTVSWTGALGGKPTNHIPYNASATCSSCHTGAAIKTGVVLHTYLTGLPCTTCHLKGNGLLGRMDTKSIGHEGMKAGDDCSKSGCHAPAGNKGAAYVRWD